MKITSFSWINGRQFDMVLLRGKPSQFEYTVADLFGFDAIQVMLATDLIESEEAWKYDHLLEMGHPMEKALGVNLLQTFTASDLIAEAEIPMARPYVTLHGVTKLCELLPQPQHEDWVRLINDIRQYMDLAASHLANFRQSRTYSNKVLDSKTGRFIDETVTPSMPVRLLVRKVQESLISGCFRLDLHLSAAKESRGQSGYLTEEELAIALSKILKKTFTVAALKKLLVAKGFMTITGKNKYDISLLGKNYHVTTSSTNTRIWRVGILQHLGSL